MADQKVMPLAEKDDDEAPYFAMVLVPGARAPAVTGRIVVVGLGPGAARLVTPEVTAALAQATDLVGYGPYLARVPEQPGQTRHASDNREEIDRARHALQLADRRRGAWSSCRRAIPACSRWRRRCSRRSSTGEAAWRGSRRRGAARHHRHAGGGGAGGRAARPRFLRHQSVRQPQAVGADRSGGCCWRPRPISSSRSTTRCRGPGPGSSTGRSACCSGCAHPATPVVFARAVSEPGEQIEIVPLSGASAERADMRTVVLVGSSQTRVVTRRGGPSYVYTPRRAG